VPLKSSSSHGSTHPVQQPVYYPVDYYQYDVTPYNPQYVTGNPAFLPYHHFPVGQQPHLATLSRNRARGQLSASAEDLLWSDSNDGQAGTLV